MLRDGKLAFGFPYPPLSLYLSTAGYAIAKDHRYALLLAMIAAAASVCTGGSPTSVARTAAASAPIQP